MYVHGLGVSKVHIIEKYLGLNDSISYKYFFRIFLFSIIINFLFIILTINFNNNESYLMTLFIKINRVIIFISIIISLIVFKDCYKKVILKQFGIFLLIFLLIMMILGISLPSLII